MKNDTIDFMELKWSNNGIPYKNNEKVFTGYTGPFPKATGHEFDGLKKSLEQDEKLWKDIKDMDFELRVKAFMKELEKLLKDYDLEIYVGAICRADDDDLIVKDLKSDKEIYLEECYIFKTS